MSCHDKDNMALDGIKVHGVSAGISESDIKAYFSNHRNGGGNVSKIFYPLLNHAAVVIFSDRNVVTGITSRRHKIKNCDVLVESLPKNIFSKVSVELQQEVTEMLDQNSPYLDVLQFEGELDVNFDPDTMNYTMTGNWYQVEWAWNYLESVSTDKNSPGHVSNRLSSVTPNISSKREDSPKFADTMGEESNISWNVNRQDGTDKFVTYQPFRSNIPQNVDNSEKKYTAKQLPANKESNEFSISDLSNKQKLGLADAHIPLLDNPLRGRDIWTSNYPQHGDYISDDTDDELTAQYLDDRSSSPEIFVPEQHITRPRCPSPKGIELLHSDFGDMPLTFDAFMGCMQVKVIMGDIVKERSDAIVNPTNQTLSNTYGISAAIARMAGRGLMDECRSKLTSHGPLSLSQVTKTCAGGALDDQVDFVLHTVPPTWREDESDSTTHILTCTYLNCLQVANKQLWLRSLSFPLIGSGGMGIPLDVSVQAFFDAIHLHVSDEKQAIHLQNVRLVSNTQDSTCSVIVVLRSLLDLDQGEAQKNAIDRYCTRSKEFNFRANDFWLDKSETDKSVDDDSEVRVADHDKNVEVPMAQKDLDSSIAINKDSPRDPKQMRSGDGIQGLESQDEESCIQSNSGQGFSVGQGRVDNYSEDHQSTAGRQDQNVHAEQDNYGLINKAMDTELLQDHKMDREKGYAVLDLDVEKQRDQEESIENSMSRRNIKSDGQSRQLQEIDVELQRTRQMDNFSADGIDDSTYKMDTGTHMDKKSSQGNEEENLNSRHDEIKSTDVSSSVGSEQPHNMPSYDQQDLQQEDRMTDHVTDAMEKTQNDQLE
ncbi:uncharacterized protein LOC132550970 [Ylistrum balloti]|uniref:uncharacterized protein LOC132550970 n=1 Tax=Ylistrum balloti TaxID=509963 RepID=UPI002905E1A6|nr:uncharacterized protein LOC132550970 [Ylistrum balloti]